MNASTQSDAILRCRETMWRCTGSIRAVTFNSDLRKRKELNRPGTARATATAIVVLPTPHFAHEHHQSMPIRGDTIDERRKGKQINNWTFVDVGRVLRERSVRSARTLTGKVKRS